MNDDPCFGPDEAPGYTPRVQLHVEEYDPNRPLAENEFVIEFGGLQPIDINATSFDHRQFQIDLTPPKTGHFTIIRDGRPFHIPFMGVEPPAVFAINGVEYPVVAVDVYEPVALEGLFNLIYDDDVEPEAPSHDWLLEGF